MIDKLRTMAVFQTVAELGSFRAAAKKLKLSPSVISHHVSQLEDQLGLPLLYRSTRRMALTDAGRDMLAASQKMTTAAQEGLASIQRRANQPVGQLSIACPTPITHAPYADAWLNFSRTYPKIQMSLNIVDSTVSLEGSEFDLAIRGRMTDLDDSSYIARKLGTLDFCIVATPEYANTRNTPKTIDDLENWDWIQNPPVPWSHLATTFDGVAPQTTPNIVVTCDNYTMAQQFLYDSQGFFIDNTQMTAQSIREGRLVRVLPKLKFRPFELFAIYPTNSPRNGLARLFVDFIMEQEWATDDGFAGLLPKKERPNVRI